MCPSDTVTSVRSRPAEPDAAVGCYRLDCHGGLQGQGVRPRVMQLARQFGLTGTVCNRGGGIRILARARADNWRQFCQSLTHQFGILTADCDSQMVEDGAQLPAEAQQAIQQQLFVIGASESAENGVFLPLDRGICDLCRREISDPGNRQRFQHLLNGCTQCGPRYSVLRRLPFDRPNTSLANFDVCHECKAAYDNPADPRCHEQLISCRQCGPRYWLESPDAGVIDAPDALLQSLTDILNRGGIVAIKGMGGFHLCCDASRPDAVVRLRTLKQRPVKPFAVMGTLAQLRHWVVLPDAAEHTLNSAVRPVVIVPFVDDTGGAFSNALSPEINAFNPEIREAIAPGLTRLGVMLPYTSLQTLLLERLGRPVIMTSANQSGEPLLYQNESLVYQNGSWVYQNSSLIYQKRALQHWAHGLDAVVYHNRDILQPVEDSVQQMIPVAERWQVQSIRLGRGMAPLVIKQSSATKHSTPNQKNVLAMGGELKNSIAFAMAESNATVLSPYNGDLYNADVYQRYQHFVPRFIELLDARADAIAVDCHPDYHATQLGRKLACQWQIPVVSVQHHHAHAVAVMAEHQLPADRKMLAVVMDGYGWGTDQTLWGGELLLCDYHSSERLARVKPFPVVGGHQTAIQPWRNGLALISQLPAELKEQLTEKVQQDFYNRFAHVTKSRALIAAVARKSNGHPDSRLLTSSAGRLFDGVAALLGFDRFAINDEAEAAVWLQQLAESARSPQRLSALRRQAVNEWLIPASGDPETAEEGANQPFTLDPSLFITHLLDQIPPGSQRATLALAFHVWLTQAVVQQVKVSLQQLTGKPGDFSNQHIVLAGGVMQNGLLVDLLTRELQGMNLQVCTPQQVPANDNGLALGQALVAKAMLNRAACHNRPPSGASGD